TFAVSLLDLAGPLVQRRPGQSSERRTVEMAFNDVAGVGRLAMAVGARQVELATAVHGAIAVVIGLALEKPFITHLTLHGVCSPASACRGCAPRRSRSVSSPPDSRPKPVRR